jgi:DNA polymerase/3'-5' exonuclease PolX
VERQRRDTNRLGIHMKLEEIQPIAETIYNQLKPYCEEGFIHIAGGIRRKKPDCHDIEICCVPKKFQISEDMFEKKKILVPIAEFVEAINKMQRLSGDAYGRYTKRLYQYGDEFDLVQVDIFMPQKEDYWRIYAIRTGSADYSARVIAYSWRSLGWVGTEDGLRRETECINKNGKWTCVSINPLLPPEWADEKDYFRWSRIPYIEPEKRI